MFKLINNLPGYINLPNEFGIPYILNNSEIDVLT